MKKKNFREEKADRSKAHILYLIEEGCWIIKFPYVTGVSAILNRAIKLYDKSVKIVSNTTLTHPPVRKKNKVFIEFRLP